MALITHFTLRKNWEAAASAGVYTAPSLERQGFIHCSTPEQVTAVANHIARNWDDTILLWIDEARVGPKIVYENLEGGTMLFPHIYGPIATEAVVYVSDFVKDVEGNYLLPELPDHI